MATYNPPLKNSTYTISLPLEDAANFGKFKAAPTLASGDFKVSIDGGALANLTTLPTNTPSGSVLVQFTLSSSEMNGDNITVVCIDQTSPREWNDLVFTLPTVANQFDVLATQASVNTIDDYLDTEIAGIKAKTDNLPSTPAAAGDSMALTSGAVDAILDEVVEGSTTMRQMLRLFASALFAEASGGGTTSVVFRDIGDTKNRITLTVDADGNRSAVTLDGT